MYDLKENFYIVKVPDSSLREISVPYDFSNPQLDLDELKVHLATCFKKYPKTKSIALIQIGIPIRIYGSNTKHGVTLTINPEIGNPTGFMESHESCASVDQVDGWNDYYTIRRPMSIVLTKNLYDGTKSSAVLYYPDTRIPSHEVDHMNGILVSDFGKYKVRSKISKQRGGK